LKKKILIVGGTGFIGFNLIIKLNKLNYSISSISLTKPRKTRKIKNVKYLICDISKKKNLEKVLEKKNYDYIVNLGGYVDHSNKKKTYSSHYLGLINLADYFKNKNLIKFIQVGSSLENGKIKSPQIENYNSKLVDIKSVYGKSKLNATRYLLKMNKKYKFPSTIFRLFQTYGPGQDPNRVISFSILQCLNNKSFPCSNGSQFRDFIHIKDVVKLLILSLKNKKSDGKIYNLGSGKPIKIKSVINKIKKIIKKGKPLFGKIKLRKDEMKYIYSNIRELKKDFNWKPLVNFNKGLIETIKFQKKIYEK
jgi:nucleoside-diphosphate-sugar epimerase